MDQELAKKLTELEQKITATYASVEKIRKYFLWTLVITILAVVLPLIGLFFAIPSFLSAVAIPAGF